MAENGKNVQGQGNGQNASVADAVLFVKNLCLTYSQLAYYPLQLGISRPFRG